MTVATPLMLAVRHTHPALAVLETQVAEVGRVNREQGERGLALFDRQLATHDFIAGARITMADLVMVASVDFARLVRFRPSEDLANVRRWLDMMMSRPGAKAGV